MIRQATLLLVLCLPVTAAAEPVLLLPPRLEAGVELVHGQAVLARVREWLMERGDRPTLITGPQAESAGLDNPCSAITCAQAYLEYYGVGAAVQTVVWAPRRTAGGRQGSVTLALVQAPAVRYMASAPIDTDAGSAALKALATLKQELARGEGPWLEVVGQPEGATVTVNGREVGKVPYLGTNPAGELVVQVAAKGYEPFGTTVFLKQAADEHRKLTVDLSAKQAATSTSAVATATAPQELPPAKRARRPWLGVVGGAVLLVASASVFFKGVESHRDQNKDLQWGGNQAESALYFAAGGVLAAGGGTALLWSSLRLRATVDRQSAGLSISGVF